MINLDEQFERQLRKEAVLGSKDPTYQRYLEKKEARYGVRQDLKEHEQPHWKQD